MAHATAAGDVSNDVDDDASSKHSDPNIWDYRVTITVSVFLEVDNFNVLIILTYRSLILTNRLTRVLMSKSTHVNSIALDILYAHSSLVYSFL